MKSQSIGVFSIAQDITSEGKERIEICANPAGGIGAGGTASNAVPSFDSNQRKKQTKNSLLKRYLNTGERAN